VHPFAEPPRGDGLYLFQRNSIHRTRCELLGKVKRWEHESARRRTAHEVREGRPVVFPEITSHDEHELDQLSGRLIEIAETCARNCIAERHAEVSEL